MIIDPSSESEFEEEIVEELYFVPVQSEEKTELRLKRKEALEKLEENWKQVIDKYDRDFEEEADEIDLETGEVLNFEKLDCN